MPAPPGAKGSRSSAKRRQAAREWQDQYGHVAAGGGGTARMIAPPPGVRIWLAAGATDTRRGFDGLAALVASQLDQDPFSDCWCSAAAAGTCSRSSTGMARGLVHDAKRLKRGHFVWPTIAQGAMSLTPAQLAMLTEAIEWRTPTRTGRPEAVVRSSFLSTPG